MANKKPPATDWRNREPADWTVATFQAYLKDAHQERYGISYTARNYGIEGRWLKSMVAEHGPEVVRKFIDACFAEYRPTPQYPGLNFGFMYSYQRERNLPRVLAEHGRKQAAEARAQSRAGETAQVDENLIDWL